MKSPQKRGSEKRRRLTEAGAALFHRRGFAGASLADVAEAAEVPVGGLYYYYRSKSDLADAVMQGHLDQFATQLEQIEQSSPDPRERLRLFWEGAESLAEARAELGCPVLALAGDMLSDPSRPDCAQMVPGIVMQHILDWLGAQYSTLGLSPEQARSAAASLFATLQGAYALGHVLQSPELIRDIFANKRTEQEAAGYL